MATTNITFDDKVLGQSNALPENRKLTFQNANEIKTAVNNNAAELDATTSLANSTSTTVNALDGTNIELIKSGGIFIDTAITDLYASKVDSVNGDTSNDVVLSGNDIDWNDYSGYTVKDKIEGLDGAVLTNMQTKVELGGDIGGDINNPTVNDGAITNAKLSDMPTNRIKGRATSGNGDVEDLTAPQTKQMLSLDNVDNTSDLNKPLSTATATALNLLDMDLTGLDNVKISKNVGTTYTTNALTTVTQSEYDSLTPDSATIYFII